MFAAPELHGTTLPAGALFRFSAGGFSNSDPASSETGPLSARVPDFQAGRLTLRNSGNMFFKP